MLRYEQLRLVFFIILDLNIYTSYIIELCVCVRMWRVHLYVVCSASTSRQPGSRPA